MPKIKKTKKHNKSTLESIGRVSASSETSSRRPGRGAEERRERESGKERIRQAKKRLELEFYCGNKFAGVSVGR